MIAVNARFLTQRVTGVQRSAMEISRHLRKLNRETKFLSPRNLIQKEMAAFLRAEARGHILGHAWEQLTLPAYLWRKGNPWLLNLANTGPLFYGKQIVTIHDVSFLSHPGWFSKKAYYYYRFLIPAIARRAVKIITVSEFSKREIIRHLHIPGDKIKVIYNGGAVFSQGQCPERKGENYGKYILAVASLDPRKNYRRILLAYKKLEMGDIKLILVGAENRVFKGGVLKDLKEAGENVIYRGYVSNGELADLYQEARLLVYPSLYEGFGIPPLEAMACGCPVVASHAASLPEICGDAAHYVDPYSAESIAEGIHKVLTDGSWRENLILRGRERTKRFSWNKSAKEYLRVWEEVSTAGIKSANKETSRGWQG
jgi:glycosyltransferase involved in cell wall biosynthesis